MCAGDDRDCPEFELHRQKLLDDLDAERRRFLKSAFLVTGGAAALTAGGVSLITPAASQTVGPRQGKPSHHYVPATADTVHWGYFSKLLKPVVEIDSSDFVTIETLTHHANDDAERMVKGDPGAESGVFLVEGQEGRRPARRRTDRRQAIGAWLRGRIRCAHLHRSGLCAQCRARRCHRIADHGREAAAVRQPELRREVVRQQRRRVVGLPLQGTDD